MEDILTDYTPTGIFSEIEEPLDFDETVENGSVLYLVWMINISFLFVEFIILKVISLRVWTDRKRQQHSK